MRTPHIRAALAASFAALALFLCACSGSGAQISGIHLGMTQEDFAAHNLRNRLGFAENATPVPPEGGTVRYESARFPWFGVDFKAELIILDGTVQRLSLLNETSPTAFAAATLFHDLERRFRNRYGKPDREDHALSDTAELTALLLARPPEKTESADPEETEEAVRPYPYFSSFLWESKNLELSILGSTDSRRRPIVRVELITPAYATLLRQDRPEE